MRRIGLEGSWELVRLSDGSRRPMAVPGDIMSALIASGELADPYYAANELEAQWVGRENWLLVKEIALDPDFLDLPRIFIEFEALDTIAELRVNGALLGHSSNMFERFRAEVREALRPGGNTIEVLIRSPEIEAAERASRLPYALPYSEYPVTSPHRNLLRKAQCMAGWDWGPCLMTGGIYDGAALVGTSGPRVEYATTRARRRADGVWDVEVAVELSALAAMAVEIEVEVAGARAALRGEVQAGASARELSLSLGGIASWWPAGYGAQPLYGMTVRCARAGGGAGGAHELRKRLGFRELEVVAREDEAGKSMVFRVNGRDIFCKGSNWIPADALPSRWTRERLDDLLSSAVEANQNCLRVWGGGRYESEDFYDLCDEKGILVWQDFMFSCALYPSSPEFLAQVEAEVRHQVKRLKDRACLALWCGNNEALGALGWYAESKARPARYLVDYDRLYEGTVGRIVRGLDPDRAWWPSSPSGGADDYSDNWHSDGRGDMHFWSVWHEGKSFSEYLSVRPRFCSEFGFQSYPSARTVASFAPPGERNPTGPVMEHHQRHPRGNAIILETMSRYFRLPSGQRETLYLSQVQQALAIKTAVEYWRSLRPRCMGTLYWQLNDVWPVSSWSSLDYDGGWKLLHFEARRFFDPFMLALILKDGRAMAVAVNDGSAAFSGSLELTLRRFDGSVAARSSVPAEVPADSAARLFEIALADLPEAPERLFAEGRLAGAFAAAGVAGADAAAQGAVERRSCLFLTEPKRCSLADPGLERRVEDGPGGPALVLRAAAPAFYVAVEAEAEPGRFDDAGFFMMPGEERRLRWIPARREGSPSGATTDRPTAAGLPDGLRAMHLRASYE